MCMSKGGLDLLTKSTACDSLAAVRARHIVHTSCLILFRITVVITWGERPRACMLLSPHHQVRNKRLLIRDSLGVNPSKCNRKSTREGKNKDRGSPPAAGQDQASFRRSTRPDTTPAKTLPTSSASRHSQNLPPFPHPSARRATTAQPCIIVGLALRPSRVRTRPSREQKERASVSVRVYVYV